MSEQQETRPTRRRARPSLLERAQQTPEHINSRRVVIGISYASEYKLVPETQEKSDTQGEQDTSDTDT